MAKKIAVMLLIAILGAGSSALAMVMATGILAEAQPSFDTIDEQFATLDSWDEYSHTWTPETFQDSVNDGYVTSLTTGGSSAPSVHISGSGYAADHGIQRSIDLSSLEPGDRLYMGVDFRAVSSTPDSSVTNAIFEVLDGNGTRIHIELLAAGGTRDSGWKSFEHDFTDLIVDNDQITVRLLLHDTWIADWRQEAYFDNFYASTTQRTMATDAKDRAGGPFDIEDGFATLKDWERYSQTGVYEPMQDSVNDGYGASIASSGKPGPSVQISGDGFIAWHGIKREIDLSSLGQDDRLYMGVDFRATSDTADSSVTNAIFEVLDEDGTQIYHEWLAKGGTTDSGWRSFEHDFTDIIGYTDRVTVRLMLYDSWIASWQQVTWFDSFYASTESQARQSGIMPVVGNSGTALHVIVDELGKLDRLEELGGIGCHYDYMLIERVESFYKATYYCTDRIDRDRAYDIIVEGSDGAAITESEGIVVVEIVG